MINRILDKVIENHYTNNKSALLLTGARQVGKTIAIRKYAQKAEMELVEINFYEDQLAKNIFIGAQNAQDVLREKAKITTSETREVSTALFPILTVMTSLVGSFPLHRLMQSSQHVLISDTSALSQRTRM